MPNKEYLYVMDCSDTTINRIDITNEEDDDVERILHKHGFDLGCCSYMYSTEELTINIIDNESSN